MKTTTTSFWKGLQENCNDTLYGSNNRIKEMETLVEQLNQKK